MSPKPKTAFMGVRISWLMLARNSLFAWLAISASMAISLVFSMAFSNCRLVSASSLSACLRSVISEYTPRYPISFSSSSSIGAPLVKRQTSRPSLVRFQFSRFRMARFSLTMSLIADLILSLSSGGIKSNGVFPITSTLL